MDGDDVKLLSRRSCISLAHSTARVTREGTLVATAAGQISLFDFCFLLSRCFHRAYYARSEGSEDHSRDFHTSTPMPRDGISLGRQWRSTQNQEFYDKKVAERREKVAAVREAGKHTEARILEKLFLNQEELEVRWEGLMRERDSVLHADLGISDLRKQLQLFDSCFVSSSLKDAKAGVLKEKEEMRAKGETVDSTLVYGEIEFMPFGVALRKLSTRYGMGPGGVFYDIGHGTGKPVLAAQLCHPFDKVGGVEIMATLFKRSEAALAHWNQNVVPQLPLPLKETKIVMAHGDCLDFSVLDWSDATVLFANSTCFGSEFTKLVAQKAEVCRKGTFFINFTNPIARHSGCWTTLEAANYSMSWGSACVYIAVRNDQPAGTPPPEKVAKPAARAKNFFCESNPHHSLRGADSFDGCVIC